MKYFRTLFAAAIFACTALSLPNAAHAACAALPNNLTNGTLADATQVMGNLNALHTCIDNITNGGTVNSGTAGQIGSYNTTGTTVSGKSVSDVLDSAVGTTQGAVIYRGASGWTSLGPGISGQVLTTGGPGADPTWTASSGGGSVLIGAGVPTALEPAGTLYSRSDGAGLYTSQPVIIGGTSVVQHFSTVHGSGIPGSDSLSTAPTPGNLIIAFISWSNANQVQPTINTSGWTQFISIPAGSKSAGFALYRYVQSGDTAALPAFCTGGTGNYWADAVYEISGVTGTFATDVENSEGINDQTHSSVTTTAETTMSSGALALIFGGQYDGSVNPTLSSGWTQDEAQHNSGNFGSVVSGHQAYGSSGASVTGTITFGNTAPGTTAMQLVLKGSGGGTLTANWVRVGP